jgi:hypothetical protein
MSSQAPAGWWSSLPDSQKSVDELKNFFTRIKQHFADSNLPVREAGQWTTDHSPFTIVTQHSKIKNPLPLPLAPLKLPCYNPLDHLA